MKITRTVMWASMSVAALGVLGCDMFVVGHPQHDPTYRGQQRQYAQQPQYGEQQPQYAEQPQQYVIVQQAPPPLIVEQRPNPPSGSYVWIDGYWNWDNQRYNWEKGRYVVPPQADVVWVAPRYETDAHGYRFTPGQWKKQTQTNGRGYEHGGN
jgi:WXXGXW repeat (2 copies)